MLSSCAEEFLPSGLGDRHHRGMLQFPFDRDGVEPFLGARQFTDRANAVLSANLFLDSRRRGKDPNSFLGEDLQEGTVLEFGHDLGPNVLRLKPVVQG